MTNFIKKVCGIFSYADIRKKDKKRQFKEICFGGGNSGFVVVGSCPLSKCFGKMKEKLIFIYWRVRRKIENVWQDMSRRIRSIDRKQWLLGVIYAVLALMALGVVATMVMFAYFSKDLPTPSKVVRRDGYTSRIYDRNGELLYDVYKEAKRTPVSWEDLPNYLKEATIAVEDKDFYKHGAVDPLTPFRIIKNVFVMGRLTGGSSVTQQLVKNVLLTSDRSVIRKIKEFILAVQIEKKYSKDEILLMYLNEAPYGGNAWGVGPAVEEYFGKPIKELNLVESVILAGLPQRPNVYSPFSKTPTAYVARSEHVLDRMREDGYINQEQADEAKMQLKAYKFNDQKNKLQAPHFVFWIKDELGKIYGDEVVEGGGLKITTTLDLKLQNEVQKIVAEEVDKGEKKYGFSNGAAMVVDPTNGQVLAMVGSRDYFSDKTDGKFNVATMGLRQPGSSIKPVTYLTAIKKGYTAASMVVDAPVTFPGVGGQKDYSPQNYTGKYLGPLTLRYALGNSINTTAVKMLAKVGLEDMLTTAYDMGISTLEPTKENLSRFGLSVTLGGGEVKMVDMVRAYSAFANGGKKIDLTGVLKVEDRDGRVLQENRRVDYPEVMKAQEAFIISNILTDNSAREMTFGSNNGLVIPNYQVAVKTGTTNDKRDNWVFGWTPNVLVGTWVGNNDNTSMKGVASGVSGATPIWRRIMLAVLPGRQKQDFPIPDRMVNMEIDRLSGYAAHDSYPSRPEYFIDGTQPRINDPVHLRLKICKGSGGLAPPEDVASGNFEDKEYIKLSEEDPVSTDGRNRWQEGIENWILTQPNQDLYRPPGEYCRSGGMVGADIYHPGDHATVGNSIDVKITTTSTKKVTELKMWVDGIETKTWSEKPFEMNINLTDGPHVIRVKATDKDGNSVERESHFGVNVPWDWSPSPTPTVTPLPSNTPTPTVILPTPTILISGT